MQGFNFPVFKTKIRGAVKKFALEDPAERRKYFDLKVGPEIKKLRNYLQKGNTFVGFLLGPKNSGKGTYAKLFVEAVGGDHIAHLGPKIQARELIPNFLWKRWAGIILPICQ